MKSDAQWDIETFEETDAAVAACKGLTPDQVKAIPRLVRWFKQDKPLFALDEYYDLRKIFRGRSD